MELNEVQQVYFEKLKLLMITHNNKASISKAEEIFNNTINAAQSANEKAFLEESLTPILQEFIRHLTEDEPQVESSSPIGDIIEDNGEVVSNTNLAGYVNIRDEHGQIIREKLDVDNDLTVIKNAVGATMKNFNKEFHDDDDMDPDIVEYLKTHGRG